MTSRGKGSGGPLVRADRRSVRRLVVTKQHLAGPTPSARRSGILEVVRDLGYVQWDPVNVVAPAHVLALRARVRGFRAVDLERLFWKERRLFQYHAHALALVPTEDLPLFRSLMRRYPESLSSSWGAWRRHARSWIPAHAGLRRAVLQRLQRGPQRLDQFPGHVRDRSTPGGWGSTSDVGAMLFHLQMRGEVTVVGQDGNQNVWGLTRDWFPDPALREELSEEEVEKVAAQRAVRAQGIATPSEINFYYVRGQYQRLREVLATLEAEGTLRRIEVDGLGGPAPRYIHREDVPLLEAIDDHWRPRISLLPPIDSMTCGKERMLRLFDFDSTMEMYVPAAKRRWGYYSLPILRGDAFLGRLDPKVDREHGRLVVQSIHAEARAPRGPEVAEEVRGEIDRLASFLGVSEVVFPNRVPEAWQRSLR